MRRGPRGRTYAAAVALSGVGLLVLAWIATNPMSGAPDELDHELRALSIGRGQLVGARLPSADPTPESPVCCDPGNSSARSWVRRGARVVTVPTRLDPLRLPCRRVVAGAVKHCDLPAATTATSDEITTMGTIEAAAYVPSALASRVAWSPESALFLVRAASAACALALLGLGLVSLVRGPRQPWRGVGALFALTPGVALLLSSPSPNAIECGAAFAFLAGILAATDTGDMARVEWAALWAGALALVLSRSLGPVWLTTLTLIGVGLNGTGALRRRIHASRVGAVALATVGIGVAVTVGWEAVVQPHVPFDARFFVGQIAPAFQQLRRLSREMVGVFGGVNVPMALYVYDVWLLVLGGFVAVALVAAAGWRDRLVLIATAAGTVGAAVLIAAALLRQNGFDVQARHVLPLAMTVPVVAGVILDRRLGPRWWWAAFAAGGFLAAVQFVGWSFNTATYTPGPNGVFPQHVWGRLMFQLAFHRWEWALVALAGAALFAAAPLVAARDAP